MLKRLLQTIPVFLLAFLTFFHPILEFSQDLGRHIKLGEIIWTTHHVPTTNLFAYTYPNFPFINHHWFSEVVFYLLNAHFGTIGLFLVMTNLGSIAFVLLFFFSAKRVSFFATFLTTLLYLNILLERTLLRPEIFSFFFISIFIVILYKNRERFTKWIFLLPILELLWVNMHIYFVIGVVLIGLFLLEPIIISVVGKIAKRKSQSAKLLTTNYLLLATVFLLSCLVTLLNPNGLTGALYPLHIFSNYGYPIQENQSLLFLINYGMWFPWFGTYILTSIGLFLLLVCYYKKTSIIDWLLYVIFTIAGCMAVRNFPLFVFATFIPFAYLLQYPLKSLRDPLKKPLQIVLCIGGIAFLLWTYAPYGFGFAVRSGPRKGVNFFIQNHLKGPIFNNFDIGSYLSYRLYPKERVFVDGRPEAYPIDFFQKEYIPMQENPKIFVNEDKKYHFNVIFFSYTDQTPWAKEFIQTIMKNSSWRLIYVDDFSAIWVKDIPENESLIQRFALNSTSISIPEGLSTQEYYITGYFFTLIGWQEQSFRFLQKAIQLEPRNCDAFTLFVNNPQARQLYWQQYTQTCR